MTAPKETREDVSPQGHPHRRMIMAIILIGIAMAVIDGAVVSIALPTITEFFGVDVAESQWIITGYMVTETSLLLVFGKLSERFGKVRLFVAGFAIFTASSLLCGFSVSLGELVFFRVIQAIGAAMVFSISAAIIFSIYPRGEQGRAMGYIGATVAVASIAAPVLGGVITDALGWEYIFLINIPIGIVLLLLAARYMKIHEEASSSGHFTIDWAGASMLILFMVSLILMLGLLAERVEPTTTVLILGGAAILFLAGFLVNEKRQKIPLLELSILSNRRFILPNIAMILMMISFFMVNLVGPFYFEGAMGLTPSQVGLVFLIAPVIMAIASPLMGWLYDRRPSEYYSVAGIALTGIAMFILSFTVTGMNLGLIILSFVPMAIGSALFQSPNNTEIMRALPPAQLGVASSLSATVRNLGMTLGISFASILLSFQLQAGGHTGPVLGADPVLLSRVIAVILAVGGFLCMAGIVICLWGNAERRKFMSND